MFSPSVSSPFTCSPGSGSNSLNCSTSTLARFMILGFVVLRPPVAQRAGGVEAAALVVEAVAHLVADHGADAAVVHRIVGVEVEERRLQDGGGEDDLVADGVVVGVDGLRRHAPLLGVDRLAGLAELVSCSR